MLPQVLLPAAYLERELRRIVCWLLIVSAEIWKIYSSDCSHNIKSAQSVRIAHSVCKEALRCFHKKFTKFTKFTHFRVRVCLLFAEKTCAKWNRFDVTPERKTASSYILESISYIFCVGACVIEIKAVPLQHHLKYDAYAFDHIHVQWPASYSSKPYSLYFVRGKLL